MATSRRRFLQLGGFALSTAGLWLPRSARASDLSLSERIDLLYSNQFHFDDQGEPRLSVGLMDGQAEVNLVCPAGIDVLPSGDGGTRIAGGSKFRISLLQGSPARQRYSIGLDLVPAGDRKALEAARKKWSAKGLDVRDVEVGSLFGVAGTVLDTRKILLLTGDYASEADAEQQARILVQRHGAIGRLHPTVQQRGKGRMIARDLERGIEIRAEGVLWFEPRRGEAMTVRDVETGTTIGPRGHEDRKYRGQIYVAVDRHGKLSVVNLISETGLLSGLVPAEIFASAPEPALRAQAVAARGQLLAKIGTRHLGDPYLLCAHQHCQVYAGLGREHPRTNAAVTATRGQVLMRPDGTKLTDTVYSANCGGHTEHNELVWPSPADPQLRGRPDPLLGDEFKGGITAKNLESWLRTSPRSYSRPDKRHAQSYRWKVAVDPASIAGRDGIPTAIGEVRKLTVLKRGRSGRAIALRVEGQGGAVDVHGELRIRRALGDLRSSMFLIEKNRNADGHFELIGGGHGHGVGMCQHGAMGMAAAGKSHGSILAHYYLGSKLTGLW